MTFYYPVQNLYLQQIVRFCCVSNEGCGRSQFKDRRLISHASSDVAGTDPRTYRMGSSR